MSIPSNRGTSNLVVMWDQLEDAHQNFKNWGQRIVSLTNQIQALPRYGAGTSAEEKQYVTDFSSDVDACISGLPTDPDPN